MIPLDSVNDESIIVVNSHNGEVEELSSKVVALETELLRANDLLAAAKGKTLSLSDAEILSLSPSASRASAMIKSGFENQFDCM